MASIDSATATRRISPSAPAHDAPGDGGADHHEGEFAARPQQQRDFRGDAVRRAEQARENEQQRSP